MMITSLDALRSLRHEAGRQGEFFSKRNNPMLAEFWFELESMAHAAISSRQGLRLLIHPDPENSHIINTGEQCE